MVNCMVRWKVFLRTRIIYGLSIPDCRRQTGTTTTTYFKYFPVYFLISRIIVQSKNIQFDHKRIYYGFFSFLLKILYFICFDGFKVKYITEMLIMFYILFSIIIQNILLKTYIKRKTRTTACHNPCSL